MAAPQALGACSRDGRLFVASLRHMVGGRGKSVKQFFGDKSKETRNFFNLFGQNASCGGLSQTASVSCDAGQSEVYSGSVRGGAISPPPCLGVASVGGKDQGTSVLLSIHPKEIRPADQPLARDRRGPNACAAYGACRASEIRTRDGPRPRQRDRCPCPVWKAPVLTRQALSLGGSYFFVASSASIRARSAAFSSRAF
jgi:hypothetical protein